MKVIGCILAGGRSSRFGTDKALVVWKGRTLLAHAIERLRPQVDEVIINTNSDASAYMELELPLVMDETDSFDGPLAGVLAGLRWAKASGAAQLVTAAVDTPLFPQYLTAAFLKQAGQKIIAAQSATGLHPTFALWPVSIEPALASWLSTGQSRKMTDFLKSQSFETAQFPTADKLDPFFNINTPEDFGGIASMKQNVIGITGWKNAGKTTLVEKLVTRFVEMGLRIATVKHAHHEFDIDHEGTDSYRHRKAGAREVAIVSARRWALMHELEGESEPPLADVLARLGPCDLVIVEGYKREGHAKIEVRRGKAGTPLAPEDPSIIAIASDLAIPGQTLPVLDLNDAEAVASFVIQRFSLAH